MLFWICAATAATSPTPQSSTSTEVSSNATPAPTSKVGPGSSLATPSKNLKGRELPTIGPLEFKPHNLHSVDFVSREPKQETIHTRPIDSKPVESVDVEMDNLFVLDNQNFPGLQTGLQASGNLCISER